jgi:hypothetical protein
MPLAPGRTLLTCRAAVLHPCLGCRVAVPDCPAPPRLWRACGSATELQSSALQQAATGSGRCSQLGACPPHTGTRCRRTAGSRWKQIKAAEPTKAGSWKRCLICVQVPAAGGSEGHAGGGPEPRRLDGEAGSSRVGPPGEDGEPNLGVMTTPADCSTAASSSLSTWQR